MFFMHMNINIDIINMQEARERFYSRKVLPQALVRVFVLLSQVFSGFVKNIIDRDIFVSKHVLVNPFFLNKWVYNVSLFF